MRYILLLFVALTTISTASYASFPVSETINVQDIEKSEISITNNIEFSDREINEINEINEVNQPSPGIMDLHWSIRLLIGIGIGLLIVLLIGV